MLSYQNTLGAFMKIRENMMTLAMYLAFDWVVHPPPFTNVHPSIMAYPTIYKVLQIRVFRMADYFFVKAK